MEPRIISLLPGATDSLVSLGLLREIVAVSHECDVPPSVRPLPVVTASRIETRGRTSGEIDATVRSQAHSGHPLYELNSGEIARLRPTHIVAQRLCEVCAVGEDDVRSLAKRLDPAPEVITLEARSLAQVIEEVRKLGARFGREDEADAWTDAAIRRLGNVATAVEGLLSPRVVCLEWLEPPMSAGHWVPEMVGIAGGGEMLGVAGKESRSLGWDEVVRADPEVVFLIPCGFDARQTSERARDMRPPAGWRSVAAVREDRVFALDADSFFSRPGPRLVDGVELLGHILHPDAVRSFARKESWIRVDGNA